jgi:hypothetical protein
MAGGAAAPLAGAAGSGLGGIGGLGGGMTGETSMTIRQRAASAMQNMGLGERLLYAAPHSLKNVALAGTTGILTAMGATHAVKSIATVMPLRSQSTVSKGISNINAMRQGEAERIWQHHMEK